MTGGVREAAVVRAWSRRAVLAMDAARERIDAVNVFPVADADTGTNVLLTLRGGVEAVEALPADADTGAALTALARGLLLSARGSSGMILSRYLGLLASAVGAGDGLGSALATAAAGARDAVQDPQEGTVLTLAVTVGAGAADRAGSAGTDGPVTDADALAAGLAAGHAALSRISAVHPVLRSARVVDAGSCALLVILDALADVLAGRTGDPVLDWLPAAADDGGAGWGPAAGAGADDAEADGCSTAAGAPAGGGRQVLAPRAATLPASPPPGEARSDAALPAPAPAPRPGAVEVMAVVPADAAARTGLSTGPTAPTEPTAATGQTEQTGLGALLAAVGDAVVVVPGTDDAGRPVLHAHVHTTDVDAVLGLLRAHGATVLRVHDLAGARSGTVACTTRSAPVGPLARTGAVVLVLDPTGAAGLPDLTTLAPLLGRAVHDAAGGRGPLPVVPAATVAEVRRLLAAGSGAAVERPAPGTPLRVTAFDDRRGPIEHDPVDPAPARPHPGDPHLGQEQR